RNVDRDSILHIYLDRRRDCLLETRMFDGHYPAPNVQWARDVFAACIRCGREILTAISVCDGDFGSSNHRSAGIFHKAYNGSSVFLRRQWCGEDEEHNKEHCREDLWTMRRSRHSRLLIPKGLVGALPHRAVKLSLGKH